MLNQTYTTLHSFSAGSSGTTTPLGFNDDGARPYASMILSGNTLYGIGNSGFAVNTDGTGFTTLTNNVGFGNSQFSGLILFSNVLYGTTWAASDLPVANGTVFCLALLPPQLAITPFGTYVILTWPIYAPGITLQSTTNLDSSAVWSAVARLPVVFNGQNAVTNAISSMQMFYRLTQ